MDKLEFLFKQQAKTQTELMHYDFANMSQQDRARYIKDHSLYCMDELHEMFHEIPFFKDWKRYNESPEATAIRWQKARVEFVDALHFFLNIAIGLGFTAEELVATYEVKNQENFRRQEDQKEYQASAEGAAHDA